MIRKIRKRDYGVDDVGTLEMCAHHCDFVSHAKAEKQMMSPSPMAEDLGQIQIFGVV